MAKGAGPFQPWEEKTESGPRQCIHRYLKGGFWGWIQAPLSGAKQQHKRQSAETDAQEVPSEYEEELFYCAGD